MKNNFARPLKYRVKRNDNIWLSQPNVGSQWKIAESDVPGHYKFVSRSDESIVLSRTKGFLLEVGNYLEDRLEEQGYIDGKSMIDYLKEAEINKSPLVSLCFRQCIYRAEERMEDDL